MPDFSCAVKPQFNILCFKIDGDDELQLKIRDELNKIGDFYISTTSFNSTRYLRLTLMNPKTDMAIIKELIKEIVSIKNHLLKIKSK